MLLLMNTEILDGNLISKMFQRKFRTRSFNCRDVCIITEPPNIDEQIFQPKTPVHTVKAAECFYFLA